MNQPVPGSRIKLIYTDDPYTHLKPGALGTVVRVTSQGDIMMEWDDGSTLALLDGVDRYEVITE